MFSYPLAFDSPVMGVAVSLLPYRLVEKLEWGGYPTVKEFEMFSRFDRILPCNRRTDGLTDILRQHNVDRRVRKKMILKCTIPYRSCKSVETF